MVASQVPRLVELMNPAPPAIDPDDPLDVAEAAMRLVDASHLPVARDRTLIGMLSLRALVADEERTTATRRAADLPPQPPIACRPNAKVADAASLLLRYRVSILPLVDDGRLVGSISRTDLVRHLPVLLGRRVCGLLVDHDVLGALHRKPRKKIRDVMHRSPLTTSPDED